MCKLKDVSNIQHEMMFEHYRVFDHHVLELQFAGRGAKEGFFFSPLHEVCSSPCGVAFLVWQNLEIILGRSATLGQIGRSVASSTSSLSSSLSNSSMIFSQPPANVHPLPDNLTTHGQEKRLRKVDEGLASRLHVSNLPFIFREPHLARLFSSYGTVTDVQVVTNEKGSKGFGFVSLSNSEEAAVAQKMLHGAVVEGRRIEVNPATPKVRPVMGPRPPLMPFCEQTMLQNYQRQMLELVEAQTRLAEAQLAVLQMRNTILNSQVISDKS